MMDDVKASKPVRFEDLSLTEQRHKSIAKQQIEKNWSCTIRECIPYPLRPQLTFSTKSKARLGAPIQESEWWQWAIVFLRALRILSELTAGKLAFAQDLMVLEVKKRQQPGSSSNRFDVAEMLRSDIHRIVDKIKQSNANDVESSGGYLKDESEGDSDESEDDGGDGEEPKSYQSEVADQISGVERPFDLIKSEPENDDREVVPNEGEHASTYKKTPNEPTHSKRFKLEARLASLRADAMRLRQEAARRDAEAYELQAKMFRGLASEAMPGQPPVCFKQIDATGEQP